MTTAAEVRDKAARKLGVLGRGQTLSAEDAAIIDASYSEVYQRLSVLGQAPWDFDEEMPDEYGPYVASLVAWGCRVDLKPPAERYMALELEAREALPEIRELNRNDLIDPMVAEYY